MLTTKVLVLVFVALPLVALPPVVLPLTLVLPELDDWLLELWTETLLLLVIVVVVWLVI